MEASQLWLAGGIKVSVKSQIDLNQSMRYNYKFVIKIFPS